MSDPKVDGYVLIDSDNLPSDDEAVTRTLLQYAEWLAKTSSSSAPTLMYRLYGGWYMGVATTLARQSASARFAEMFPTVRHIFHKNVRFRLQFADSIIRSVEDGIDDEPDVTHTVAVRRSLGRARVKDRHPCGQEGCERQKLAKWLRKRKACPATECSGHIGDTFETLEQKQVDIHLALDLNILSTSTDIPILIASDDTDFTPAILAANRCRRDGTIAWARSHTSAKYMDQYLEEVGVRFLQTEADA